MDSEAPKLDRVSHKFLPGYPIAGRRDGFAFADRATAGSGKTLPLFKNKAALQAGRRVHGQSPGMDRSGNMLQMIEDFLFTNTQDLGNLTEVHRFLFQKRGDFFADRWHRLRGGRWPQKKQDKKKNGKTVWGIHEIVKYPKFPTGDSTDWGIGLQVVSLQAFSSVSAFICEDLRPIMILRPLSSCSVKSR